MRTASAAARSLTEALTPESLLVIGHEPAGCRSVAHLLDVAAPGASMVKLASLRASVSTASTASQASSSPLSVGVTSPSMRRLTR